LEQTLTITINNSGCSGPLEKARAAWPEDQHQSTGDVKLLGTQDAHELVHLEAFLFATSVLAT
jgi:hypothetical protein